MKFTRRFVQTYIAALLAAIVFAPVGSALPDEPPPDVSLSPGPAPGAIQYRDEFYTVRRPVVETSMREQRYVVYEPVTTFENQQVDQGNWVDEQVVKRGRKALRLRWFEGGWTVDPATGREYWRPPMLRPVREPQPPKVETVRTWKPNLVTIAVPKTTYAPQVHVRQVPVDTVRYVEERRVRRVPYRCDAAPIPAPAVPPVDATPHQP